MTNILVVGGNIDSGKPSSIIRTLSEELMTNIEIDIVTTFNGIMPTVDLNGKDLVCWLPDINNEVKKDYPVKDKGAVLICSKVIRDDTTRIDAVSRIFRMHANAVIMIYKHDKYFEFELVDALNNTWCKTTNINELAKVIKDLYKWTKDSKRRSLTQTLRHKEMWEVTPPKGLKQFIAVNQELALKVAAGCGNRFFGNFSTRCTKLFPSSKISPTAFYVSPRNVDKRSVSVDDLVLIDYTYYFGKRKPSVDAPVQLELYRATPDINFMIHGHAYITNTDVPTTTKYYPCGDLREAKEVINLLSYKATRINLKNHGFLLVGETLEDMANHLTECNFKMLGE